MQVRPAAYAQVERSAREPCRALVGFGEVGPDALDRSGEQAFEAHRAWRGGSAHCGRTYVVHFLLLGLRLGGGGLSFFAAAIASSARSIASRASSRPVQKARLCSIHLEASASGAALKERKWSRPATRRRTRSARSRMRMCFETELSEMSKGAGTSGPRASPRESRCRMARRVGSARAMRVSSSSMAQYSPIWVNIVK